MQSWNYDKVDLQLEGFEPKLDLVGLAMERYDPKLSNRANLDVLDREGLLAPEGTLKELADQVSDTADYREELRKLVGLLG